MPGRARTRAGFLLALAAASALTCPAASQPCRLGSCGAAFPPGSGAIDVRDYGARGDGRTDDTEALRKAATASGGDTGRAMWQDRPIFLPAGTYLVSGSIFKRYANGDFASGMALIGAGVDKTTIRLVDHAPGFADPALPRGVIMTSSKLLDSPAGRDYQGQGEGNDAYENYVQSLTIDVGEGNGGAIGIDYLANNIGAIRDVRVRALAGEGATGIAMTRKWPGPALLQRVSVEGFAVGIDVAQSEYGVTLSRVSMTGQRVAGLRNDGNAVSADALRIATRSGTAIVNTRPSGMIVLAGGALQSAGGSAIENRGSIVFRDTVIEAGTKRPAALPTGALSGVLTGADHWETHAGAWKLPLPEAPLEDDAGPAVVVQPPADETEDSTARLAAALHGGAATLYLAHGNYRISEPLDIPPGLRRIIGMNSTIRVFSPRKAGFSHDTGMVRVTQPGRPLTIAGLALDNTGMGLQSGVEIDAGRTVVIHDVVGAGVVTLDRRAQGGPVFLENTCCGLVRIAGTEPVVARQLNSEGGGVRIINAGAKLAVIGLKTEGYTTAVATTNGGRSEILGGLLYVVRTPSGADMPAFAAIDASLTASVVEESLRPASHYTTMLSAKKGATPSAVQSATLPPRGLGRMAPFLSTEGGSNVD